MAVTSLDVVMATAALAPKPAKKTTTRTPSAQPSGNLGSGDYNTLDVVAWFAAHGHDGRSRPDGKYTVLCPWSGEHSDDQGANDPDTVVWPADGGWPTFHCSHAHCTGRTLQSVMDLWGDQDQFCAQRFERPEMWPVNIQPPAIIEQLEGPVAYTPPTAWPTVGDKNTERFPPHSAKSTLTERAAGMRRQAMDVDEITDALLAINERRCEAPLPLDEIREIAESVCKFQPAEASNWRVMGAAGAFTGIDPLRRIGSNPPCYEATVCGIVLELTGKQLCSWVEFKFVCATQLHYLPELPAPDGFNKSTPEQTRWEKEFVAPALERMKRDGCIEEAPEDASAQGATWDDVRHFCGGALKVYDTLDDAYDHGKIARWEGYFYFRGRTLRNWLILNNIKRLTEAELWVLIRKKGGVQKPVRTSKGIARFWKLPELALVEESPEGPAVEVAL